MSLGDEIKKIENELGIERINIRSLPFVHLAGDETHYHVSGIASFPVADIYVDRPLILSPESVSCIHGGTKFLFSESSGILCSGILKAEGTEQKRILFGPSRRTWGNISIATHMASGSYIHFCDITGGMGLKEMPTNTNIHPQEESFLGGGIIVSEADISMKNCKVFGNHANFGGGVYFFNSKSDVSNTHVYANSANFGGGIYSDCSQINFHNLNLEKCTADFGGGAFLARDKSKIDFSKINWNQARKDGGGLHLDDSSNLSVDSKTQITDNRALKGGGISSNNSFVSLKGSSVLSNLAELGAGMFLGVISEAEIKDMLIEGNRADVAGGGVYSDHSRISLNSSSVTDNWARKEGGGVYVYGMEANIENCVLERNISKTGAWIFLRYCMLRYAGPRLPEDCIHSDNSVIQFQN